VVDNILIKNLLKLTLKKYYLLLVVHLME